MSDRLNKIISIIIAIVFTANSLAYAGPAISPQPIVPSPQSINISEAYGRVDKCQISQSPQVILIKDAHCNYEAQRNIAKILDILIKDYKIALVGIEGASGDVDPSVIADSPDEKRRKEVADKYLKKGWLTASEALAMERGKDYGFSIWGVEDFKLYLNDLKAFREVYEGCGVAERFIKICKDIISNLKNKIYSEDAVRFDRKVNEYRENKLALSEFINYLAEIAPSSTKGRDGLRGLPNLGLVLKVINIEKNIDFKKVEQDRNDLIKECEKRFPKEEIERLVKNSLLYKLGKISSLEYYKYLEPLATGYLPRAANLRRYIRNIKLHSKIDEDGLFNEIDKLKADIYAYYVKNEIAVKLHKTDEYVYLLGKLLRLEITRDELVKYRESCLKPSEILDFLKIQGNLNNVNIPPELTNQGFILQVGDFYKQPEEFYKYAIERDKALVENLIARMKKENKNRAVLIAGGFHADGAEKLLRENGIDVITITPSITKEDTEAKKIYLSRMMDERIQPDNLLNEMGLGNLGTTPITAVDLRGIYKQVLARITDESARGRLKDALDSAKTDVDFEAIMARVAQGEFGIEPEAKELVLGLLRHLHSLAKTGRLPEAKGGEPVEVRKRVWDFETESINIDGITVTVPSPFMPILREMLNKLYLPETLYAGDTYRLTPMKPIDVFAFTADELGVKGREIRIIIGEMDYVDISEDGKALEISISKFRIANPNMGFSGAIDSVLRILILNKGRVVTTRNIAEQNIRESSRVRMFGRYLQNERAAYNITPGMQKAYYRGVRLAGLQELSEEKKFTGANSDSLFINLEPTIWASTDIGCAEIYAGKNIGVIFKLKKEAIDRDFKVLHGWQRWTVNEKILQSKDEKPIEIPLSDAYIEEILVFDEASYEQAKRLFPDIPIRQIFNPDQANQYLAENGEMTNAELEEYYSREERLPEYMGRPLSYDNRVLQLAGVGPDASYEQFRAGLVSKKETLKNEIKSILESKGFRLDPFDPIRSTWVGLAGYVLRNDWVADKQTRERIKGPLSSYQEVQDQLLIFDFLEYLRAKAINFKEKQGKERGAIIPVVQEQFREFGKTKRYKLLAGPAVEEALYRYTPFAVFFKGLMPEWYEKLAGKSAISRVVLGVIYSVLYFASLYFGYDFNQLFYIGFVLLSIPLFWGFITAHPSGKREEACIAAVGIITGVSIGLVILNSLYTLIIPIAWHVITNIIYAERERDILFDMRSNVETDAETKEFGVGSFSVAEKSIIIEEIKNWIKSGKIKEEDTGRIREIVLQLAQCVKETRNSTPADIREVLELGKAWLESHSVDITNAKDVIEQAAKLAQWAKEARNSTPADIKQVLELGKKWLDHPNVTDKNAGIVITQAASLAQYVKETSGSVSADIKEVLELGMTWLESDNVTKINAGGIMSQASLLALYVQAVPGTVDDIKEVLELGKTWLDHPNVTDKNAEVIMEQAVNTVGSVQRASDSAADIKAVLEGARTWLESFKEKVTEVNVKSVMEEAANLAKAVKATRGSTPADIREVLELAKTWLESRSVDTTNAHVVMAQAVLLARKVDEASGNADEIKAGIEGAKGWLESENVKPKNAASVIEQAANIAKAVKATRGSTPTDIREVLELGKTWLDHPNVTDKNAEVIMEQAAKIAEWVKSARNCTPSDIKEVLELGKAWLESRSVDTKNAGDVMEQAAKIAEYATASHGTADEIKAGIEGAKGWLESENVTPENAASIMEQAAMLVLRVEGRGGTADEIRAGLEGANGWLKSEKVTPQNAPSIMEQASWLSFFVKDAGGSVADIKAGLELAGTWLESHSVDTTNAGAVMRQAANLAKRVLGISGGVPADIKKVLELGKTWLESRSVDTTDAEVVMENAVAFVKEVKRAGGSAADIKAGFEGAKKTGILGTEVLGIYTNTYGDFLTYQKETGLTETNQAVRIEQYVYGLTLMADWMIYKLRKLDNHPLIALLSYYNILLTPAIIEEIKSMSESDRESYIQNLNTDIENFKEQIKTCNLASLTEKEKALLYNALHRMYPALMERVPYYSFLENTIVHHILAKERGDESFFYFSDSDRNELINLSLEIEQGIRKYTDKHHQGDALWETSFRQQMQIHRDFINQYFSPSGKPRTEGILQKFILACYAHYGDMFGSEIELFQDVLAKAIERHFEIFVRFSLGDDSVRQYKIPELIAKLRHTSITNLEGEGEILYGVKPYEDCYWGLRRAVELNHPALCILEGNTHHALDESINKLNLNGVVYRVCMNAETDRGVLFANAVPDKDGVVHEVPGLLPLLIEEAQKDSSKPIYLVLENIESLPEGVRVDLNPVIWEKRFVVPELGKKYTLPPNLHIIATMHSANDIRDKAFANRFSKVRVTSLTGNDIKKLLIGKYKLPQNKAETIGRFYDALQQLKFKDNTLLFTVQDIINVLKTAEGRGSIEEYFAEELYRYYLPRFRHREDLKQFNEQFKNTFKLAEIPKGWTQTKAEIKGNMLVIDGVEIELSREVMQKKTQADFKTMVLGLFGYVIRKQDLLVLSQCVRQLRYGGNPFIILEGISGEGKTEFTFLLGKLFGKEKLSYTIHGESNVEELRGGVYGDGRGRLVAVRETAFTRALQSGNTIINFSELNTNDKQKIGYFLMPEALGLPLHIMPEVPEEDGGIKHAAIGAGNLYIADINPLDYTAREPLPVRMRENALVYWMGYDYSSRDEEYKAEIKTEITTIIEQLFIVNTGNSHSEHAKKLAEIYLAIQNMLYTDIPSSYQVLTLRDIIRVIRIFKDRGSTEDAFKRAVRDILWGMWIEEEIRDKVHKILTANKITTEGYNPQELTQELFKLNLAPIILHSDGTQDGLEVLKKGTVPEKGDSPLFQYMAVNEFTDYETLIGGGAVDEGGDVGEYPGSLLKVIEQCIQNPSRTYIFVFDNIHQLSADTAVGFNRLLQDGVIDIQDKLKKVLTARLQNLGIQGTVEDIYGRLPKNLRIAGISYANPKPMSNDKLPMSGAELSRYINIRAGEGMSLEWVKGYIEPKISYLPGEIQAEILKRIEVIYKEYVREQDRGILLSRYDLDEFITQITQITQIEELDRVFSETIGSALQLPVNTDPALRFEKRDDGVYLITGTHRMKTGYNTIKEAEGEKYLTPIKENRQIYSAVGSAIEAGRRVFLLEGHPGVGKTAFAEDFAKRMGLWEVVDAKGKKKLRFEKSSMCREVEIWDYLGKMEQTGPGKFRLTCTKEQGKYISAFLKIIEKGGVFCFDEGNIGRNSIQVISFLMQIMRREPIELGLYHNGVEIGSHRINIRPHTYIFVTYNPAGLTEGREPLSREINLWAKKIWVTDNWSRESYRELVRGYDKHNKFSSEQIEKLIDIHIAIKYIIDEPYRMQYMGEDRARLEELRAKFTEGEFRGIYKYQYSITPREIIRTTEGGDLYEGILLNYIYQFSDRKEFNSIMQIIETIIPGYAKWYREWLINAESEYKSKEDVFFVPVKSQAGALKAIDASVRSGGHTMLVSEDGAEPYELVKVYAKNKGYELRSFWGNPYSNSIELMGGRYIQFSDMDDTGTASQEGVGSVKGFLGAYLVEKGKTVETKPTLLYLGSLDTLSHEDLELLNDFLNTKEIELEGKTYKLRPDVHLIVEASVVRQKHFSSPFYNRFQKVGIPAVTDFGEIKQYMDRYYTGLTETEKELIYNTVMLAWCMDAGLSIDNHNLQKQRLSYRYGFNIRDIWHICELVLMQKEGKKEIDSVIEVLKAVTRYYLGAVDDVNGDRKKFIDGLLYEVFIYEGMNEDTIKGIIPSLREVEREWIETQITIGANGRLQNGIWIEEKGDKYIAHTPGNQYPIHKLPEKGEEIRLSDGLILGTNDRGLYIKQGFIKSVGGMDMGLTETAKQYALPPEEVSEGNFIKYKGVINEIASSLLWAIRRSRNTGGYESVPRPVVLMGETGGAKSTLVRNTGEVLGIPVYTLNCFLDMEPDSFTGQMELRDGEQVFFRLQELFSNVGKINGNYRYPQGKQIHSTRKLLFLDEGNVSPEIMYALRPLWKGERKFTIYYLGMALEVELDPEVIVVFSGNPEDRFEGRSSYPLVGLQECVKIWVPALQEWSVSDRVTQEDEAEVLRGLHERRMGRFAEEERTVEDLGKREERKNMEADVIQLQRPAGDVNYIERAKTKKPSVPKKQKKPKRQPMTIKKHLPIKYNINEIEAWISSDNNDLEHFITKILQQFILAVGDGAVQVKNWQDNHESLTYRVVQKLQGVDEEIAKTIAVICTIYSQPGVSYTQIQEQALKLRQYLLKKGSKYFIFSFPILKGKKLYVFIAPEEITYRAVIQPEMAKGLNMKVEVRNRLPLTAYAVEKHPFGEQDKARGVTKGVDDKEGYYALIYGASTGTDEEVLSWVGYHELGHVVSELRIRFEQLKHPNVELFSMLFPVLFAKEAKRYMQEELLRLLKTKADKDDYYCQAAKGIFNAFAKVLNEEKKTKLELVTDEFEGDIIDKIWQEIDKLTNEEMKDIGIKIYNDCYAKNFTGEYYLNTTGAGRYKMKRGGSITGDMISEFTEGELQQGPDVEWEDVPEEEQKEIQQEIDIQREGVDEDKTEEIGNVEMDMEGIGAGEGIQGTGGIQVIRGSWVEGYSRIFSVYAKRFLDIFAKEPKREEIYGISGRRIAIRKVVAKARRVFKKTRKKDMRPQCSLGITVDVSGSITSNPELVKGFTLMSKFFLSLMYSATKLHRGGVWYGLSAIGEQFHNGLPMAQKYTEKDLENIVSSDDRDWMNAFKDGSGINTENLLIGLRKKWSAPDMPKENRLEIVFTDGGDYGADFNNLRKMAEEFEHDTGVTLIFVGIGTEEVKNYHRHILLSAEPKPEEFINIISKLSVQLVRRGRLDKGDLNDVAGVPQKQDVAAHIKMPVFNPPAPTVSTGGHAGYEDKDSNPAIVAALEKGDFACVNGNLEAVNKIGPYDMKQGNELNGSEIEILSTGISELNEADRKILEGLLVIFIPGLSAHYSRQKYPQIYFNRNLLSNRKYIEDLKWQMHHEIQEKNGKTHAELIREELRIRFKIDIEDDLDAKLAQKARDLLRVLTLDGEITEDEVGVIVDKAKLAVSVFNEYRGKGLKERLGLVQEIVAVQWAIEELEKNMERNNVPEFVNELIKALGGDEEIVRELVMDLYNYNGYDDYFTLMLDGIRTMFDVDESHSADKYLKMLDEYKYRQTQLKGKFNIDETRFTGNGDEIYNILMDYPKKGNKELLDEVADIAARYLACGEDESENEILNLFKDTSIRNQVKEGIGKLISRKDLMREEKPQSTLLQDMPKEKVARAKKGYEIAGKLVDQKAELDLRWQEGIPLTVDSRYIAVKQGDVYVINPTAEQLLWLLQKAGNDLRILYKNEDEKKAIEGWFSEKGAKSDFITKYPGEYERAVSILAHETAMELQVPKGHRVIRGTEKGEDDPILMSRMAAILSRENIRETRDDFTKLLKGYYGGSKRAEDINSIVDDIMEKIGDGLRAIVITLPPIAPFIKVYYNTLKQAMEMTASAA